MSPSPHTSVPPFLIVAPLPARSSQSPAAMVWPSADSAEVARLFKAAMSPDGFFQEAHVKLRPVDFAADGVFLCGAAHYPKHMGEAVAQAYGAAGRAVTLLSRDTVTASGSVCEVDEDAWTALYSTKSLPFAKPKSGKIAVKVINHYGDEVLKVLEVE